MGMLAWAGLYGFGFLDTAHLYFVFPVLSLILFLGGAGILTRCLLTRSRWGTRRALRVKRAHKIMAYFSVLAAGGAVATGIFHFRTDDKECDVKIEWIVVPAYFSILIVLEATYWVGRCLKHEKQLGEVEEDLFESSVTNTITYTQFKERVQNGEKLVILDEYVLDISEFMYAHPGGTFSLSHNIGRDISKFFHGGYSLEQIYKVREHKHSNDARRICNSLIIGHLQSCSQTRVMNVTGKHYKTNSSGTIKTVEFVDVYNIV